MNKYQETMDMVRFSEDVEKKIYLSVMDRKNDIVKRKEIHFPIAGTIIACAAIIFLIVILNINGNKKSGLITREYIEETLNIDKVRDIMVYGDDGKFAIESVNIEPGEMVIFNTNTKLEKGKELILKGEFISGDLNYNIGYIFEGKYHEVMNSNIKSSMTESIQVTESGNYYWCIINTSYEKILFDGDIQILASDLLYRGYGDEAIVVDKPCILRIHSSFYDGKDVIKGIYVYNYQTQQEIEVGNGLDLFYKVVEPGAYSVYAVFEKGGIVNLRDFVTIEYEVDESCGIFCHSEINTYVKYKTAVHLRETIVIFEKWEQNIEGS